MGFNTTVVVMNDALQDIQDDPDFGKKLVAAISKRIICDKPIGVSAGCHSNAATVIELHHADIQTIVAIGRNYGREIGYVSGWITPTTENVLKELARNLGYVIFKKKGK